MDKFHMTKSQKFFVRSGQDGESPSYIAQELNLTIKRQALEMEVYSKLVSSIRSIVEGVCQSYPSDQLDSVTITLRYGVVNHEQK